MAAPHLVRTEAVVLRRHDLGEADRIVTLYTASAGKLRAVAKGVRRPTSRLGGHLELFTRCQVMLARGRNLDLITQVETVDPHLGIREDLWRAGLAYYAAETLDRLTEDRGDTPPIYPLLVHTLDRIATSRRPNHALHYFLLHLLGILGYRPELQLCVHCRRELEPVENGFSPLTGGALCSDCRPLDPGARRLSVNALKVMRFYQASEWDAVERLRLVPSLADEIEEALRGYVQHLAESKLKSAGFVATLRNEGLA